MSDGKALGPKLPSWRMPPEEAWRKDAACIGHPTEMWFPDRGEQYAARKPKAICRECPARMDCLRYAMEHREQWGIWGGITMPKGRYRIEHLMEEEGISLTEAVAIDDAASDDAEQEQETEVA